MDKCSSVGAIPLGIFWDIENCCVPHSKSALHVVQTVREQFIKEENREVEFMCVCDTSKENRNVILELNQAQVNVVHIDAVSKNAADDKLRQNIRRFSDIYSPPAVIVLITSDVNFSTDLYDLRYRKKFDIILLHQRQIHDSLLLCASEHFEYDNVVKDVPSRSSSKSPEIPDELIVTGYPANKRLQKLKSKLQQLFNNTGGKVVSVTSQCAVIRFTSSTAAERARHRMEGHDVFGSRIHLDYMGQGAYTGNQGAYNIGNEQSGNNTQYQNNVSPDRDRPYSQRKSRNFKKITANASDENNNNNLTGTNAQEDGNASPHLVDHVNQSGDGNFGIQGLVQKFDQEKKSSRQMLMLRQQIYQEGQTPIQDYGPHSTQFYSQYKETSYCAYNQPVHQGDYQSGPGQCQGGADHVQGRPGQYQGIEHYQGGTDHYQSEPGQYQGGPGQYQGEQGQYQGEQGQYQGGSGQYQGAQRHYQGEGDHYQGGPGQFQGGPGQYQCGPGQYHGYQQLNNSNNSSYYNNYQNAPHNAPQYYYGNTNKAFCPIRPGSSNSSSASSSPCEFDVPNDIPGAVDLIVSNLDYNISPREWKHILTTTFHPHVKILHIDVSLQPDNTSLGLVKVGSIEEARFAISQFHRKKIGYKRIHVTLKSTECIKTVSNVRSEAIALLSDAKGNVLPLFKFIELFNKRFNRPISVSELYKMRDTIEVREQGGAGRMIHLIPSLQGTNVQDDNTDGEVQEILEQVVCLYHCPEGSSMHIEAVNTSILPNVKVQLKTFAAQVHSLLMTHDGNLPLKSFTACYAAEVMPLAFVYEGGVPLEHLISCVPGIEIITSPSGVKKVSWSENKTPNSPDLNRPGSSPLLVQQLNQISKEMVDLLRSSPGCRMAFSKFIPSYHHHFGRQCRVADYGYSKLLELFEAIPHVLQILGTGDRKVLTLSHRAQCKRFMGDLLRLLKSIPGKQLYLSSLADEFCKFFKQSWDITDYGVCYIEDMLSDLPSGTVNMMQDGHETIISLPRKDQSSEEIERTKHFTLEVIDILKHSHQCRMLFNKFIPAYHHHFGRQCRVSDYGFLKLQDLFEAIPNVVELEDEGEEKVIHLTEPELRKVVGEQIVSMLKLKKVECFPMDKLMITFTQHYGYQIPLNDINVFTVEELMSKLKHVLKVEQYDNKTYVVLADRTSAPPLARQVLQLLMDQSGGSLPLMELCSRYKTTFGIDPDIRKIKEELLEYVTISGDDESGVISLTPLQILARDIRILLQQQGKVSLQNFERLYYEKFCMEITPALYGFPSTVGLLMAIPHVVSIKGKGQRRIVHLSGDLQSSMPIIDESYTRPDSDTPSNDSGSALADEDTPCEKPRPSPLDLLGGSVPSEIPSPLLEPSHTDLIRFSPCLSEFEDKLFSLTDDDKRNLQSPLCQTPTSQILKLAAQFLPTTTTEQVPSKQTSTQNPTSTLEPETSPSNIMDMLKQGWWKDENQSAMAKELVQKHTEKQDDSTSVQHTDKSNTNLHATSVSATISLLRRQTENKIHNTAKTKNKENKISVKLAKKGDGKNEPENANEGDNDEAPIALCPRPLQPGSYWFSKQFENKKVDLPCTSPEDVRKVLASLSTKHVKPPSELDKNPPAEDEDVNESKLDDTIIDLTNTSKHSQPAAIDNTIKIAKDQDVEKASSDLTKGTKAVFAEAKILKPEEHNKGHVHKLENCVAEDCMCYEAVFREDHDFATSTVKSDSSLSGSQTGSPSRSPKVRQQRLSSGSQSDESQNNSISRQRKCRIAAKFEHPVSTQ